MPSTTPRFSSLASSSAKISSSSSSIPYLSAIETTHGQIYSSSSSSPIWVPNPSLWRRSGSSYFGRFDDEHEIDNTYTPIDSGLDLIFGGTGFELHSSNDVYVGTLVDPNREAVWVPLPACNITNFYVASSVSPGVGQTFTFTVYKDTIATSMIATISGSGTSASFGASTITFSAGEKFSVRIQCSSGANSAFLTYSARIE